MTARLIGVQVALPRELPAEGRLPAWRSAIFKQPVTGEVRLTRLNLEGDRQADLVAHGGPDKALMAYAASHYPDWGRELPQLDLGPGGFGENLTVEGLDEEAACIGDVYRVGSAVVQVSQPRQPCWKLARRWGVKDLALRVRERSWTGWYLRVLEEGVLRAGDGVELLERPNPGWTVRAASAAMVGRRRDPARAAELARCRELSAYWRKTLVDLAVPDVDTEA